MGAVVLEDVEMASIDDDVEQGRALAPDVEEAPPDTGPQRRSPVPYNPDTDAACRMYIFLLFVFALMTPLFAAS